MTSATSPSVWALLGDKLGDNAQVQAIIDALGMPVEIKYLRMLEQWEFGKPRFQASLKHIDWQASDSLEPPWPRLIITIGRRLSQAALWVKEQSGNTTKVALVGRPKRWPDRFDLVIGLPQYDLPDAPNIVHLSMPLMRPDLQRIASETTAWHERLASMPKPLTAVMVGGQTQPFRFDRKAANELGEGLRAYLRRDGGSLYVSTSRRTGRAVSDALRAHIIPPSKIYDWAQDPVEENPYHALLGTADRIIVTTDSVSMIVEAVRMFKPLSIYPLPRAYSFGQRLGVSFGKWAQTGSRLGQLVRFFGGTGFTRDLSAFRHSMEEAGLAVPFGEPFRSPSQLPKDDIQETVDQVRALL